MGHFIQVFYWFDHHWIRRINHSLASLAHLSLRRGIMTPLAHVSELTHGNGILLSHILIEIETRAIDNMETCLRDGSLNTWQARSSNRLFSQIVSYWFTNDSFLIRRHRNVIIIGFEIRYANGFQSCLLSRIGPSITRFTLILWYTQFVFEI